MKKSIKGFKAFDHNMQCRGFQFKVGGTFTHTGDISLCNSGFHFCEILPDCYNYYPIDSIICEIMAWDVSDEQHNDSKRVAGKIKIIRQLGELEIFKLRNSGNSNSGNSNSGSCNSGNRNSGDWNSGNRNSGSWNSGSWNSGSCNSGNWNSGSCNSGNRNSGDWNSGNRNSGSWNSGSWNSGDFNTNTPDIINILNRPCDRKLWESAQKPNFIFNIILTEYINNELIHYNYKEAWKKAFESRNNNDIELLKALPNFDAKIFFEITGIEII